MKYLRIGTDYYKICQKPLFSGDKKTVLLKWSKGEIITDHGKDFLEKIEKYDGFVIIPEHINYKKTIDNFYNKYEEIKTELKQGEFPATMLFLKHIFNEQIELGIDYLTLLWQKPTQILPILCLVSSDRNTGKTTFLNWLKLIFQGNMTINKNEDFRSQFNSDWASSLLVGVDEVLLDRKEDSEQIKNLSTASTYKTEAKGKDRVESDFFGKFVLCSNNEEGFIKIDEKEIRYWVRKIPSLISNNTNLLSELKAEIPHFLYFLTNRQIVTKNTTRMWFSKNDIYTEALAKLVKGNKCNLSKELEEVLIDDFLKFEKDELKYSLSDLLEKLKGTNIRVNKSIIAKTIREDFNKESVNGSYKKYFLSEMPGNSFTTSWISSRGRHFTFHKSEFLDNTTQQ